MFLVSDKCESVNERTFITDQQKNKVGHSTVSPEVPMN